MSDIHYVTGDATYPRGSGPRIIAHNCNDAGRWGAGFVEAVSERFPSVENAYREWAKFSTYGTLPLGEVQFVQVGDSLWIANMIGQVGRRTLNVPPFATTRSRKPSNELVSMRLTLRRAFTCRASARVWPAAHGRASNILFAKRYCESVLPPTFTTCRAARHSKQAPSRPGLVVDRTTLSYFPLCSFSSMLK